MPRVLPQVATLHRPDLCCGSRQKRSRSAELTILSVVISCQPFLLVAYPKHDKVSGFYSSRVSHNLPSQSISNGLWSLLPPSVWSILNPGRSACPKRSTCEQDPSNPDPRKPLGANHRPSRPTARATTHPLPSGRQRWSGNFFFGGFSLLVQRLGQKSASRRS